MILRTLALAIISALFAFEAAAQRLVASSSDPQISINSTFSGEEITFFWQYRESVRSACKCDHQQLSYRHCGPWPNLNTRCAPQDKPIRHLAEWRRSWV